MSGLYGDVSDFYVLANDLSKVSAKAVPALRQVLSDMGGAVVSEWRDNAKVTAGEHGKHYPDSITSELAITFASVSVDVGPDPSRKQGGMSFEFGSRNQPPHLDGLRAIETVSPRVERAVDTVIGVLFDE